MMKATENNWPMACGTNRDVPNYLFGEHAYTVLGAFQLKNPDGSDGPKLIKIRNPHGTTSKSRYNTLGPWRIDSDKWTDSYQKQTGFTKDKSV